MKYRALVSFSGLVSMAKGDVREISDVSLANDLLKASYIEEFKPEEAAKAPVKAPEKTPVKASAKTSSKTSAKTSEKAKSTTKKGGKK